MTIETVTLIVDRTWTLLSAAAAGPFEAQVREPGQEITLFVGSAPPAADYAFGLRHASVHYETLEAKLWAKAEAPVAVTCTRTVDAGNTAEILLPPLGLSATSFAENLAPGAEIAAITGRIPGDRIDLLSADGRLALSADGTKLLRGIGAVAIGGFESEIVASHAAAPNSPRRSTLALTVTQAPPLAISGDPQPARAGSDYVFKLSVANVVGTLALSRSGGTAVPGLTIDPVARQLRIPGASLVDGQTIDLGTITANDDRGVPASLLKRTVFVSALDYLPFYGGNQTDFGLDPETGLPNTYANHSAFKPWSIDDTTDGRWRRFAISAAGESVAFDTTGSQRSELNGAARTAETVNGTLRPAEIWIFETLRVDGFVEPSAVATDWTIFGQIHAPAGTGEIVAPVLAQELRPDGAGGLLMQVVSRTSPLLTITNPDLATTTLRASVPIERGAVYHRLVHLKHGMNGDGAIEEWFGPYGAPLTKIVDLPAVSVGYAGKGLYYKPGVYRGRDKARYPNGSVSYGKLSHRVTGRFSLADYATNPLLLEGTRLTAGTPATAIAVTRTADGSVGQTYSAAATPAGAPIQWTRTTVGANPVTSDIANATGASYVATQSDVNHVLGARALVGPVATKAAGRVLRAPIVLERCETADGWSASGVSRTIETASDALEGSGGLRLAQLDGGNGSQIFTDKTVADTVAPADLETLVLGVKNGFNSQNSLEVSLRRGGVNLTGVSLSQAIFPGRRIYSGRPYDFASGMVGGGGFQRGNAGVSEPVQPTDVAQSGLRFRIGGMPPGKAEARLDFVLGRAGGVPKFALTFDDGFASAFEYFIDVLHPAGIPATFFPPAGKVNLSTNSGGNGIAKTGLVIQAMRLGALIGTNTRGDNPFTDYADAAAAVQEYRDARQALADKLRTDPTWNETSDMPLLQRGLDMVCLSNGQFQTSYASSVVTGTVTAGAPRIMTFASVPGVLPEVGSSLDGWWPEAGLARVVSVAADGLSVTLDRDVTPQTKGAIFMNDHRPFFHQKLMDAFRAAGVKLVRGSPAFSYPSNRSNNPRMSTRFGFGDYDMSMPAQAAPATTTADQTAYLQRWYREGKHYECTSVLYVHGVIDEATTIGVNHRKAALDALVDYSAADRASGAVEFVDLLQLYESDGRSSVPAA